MRERERVEKDIEMRGKEKTSDLYYGVYPVVNFCNIPF